MVPLALVVSGRPSLAFARLGFGMAGWPWALLGFGSLFVAGFRTAGHVGITELPNVVVLFFAQFGKISKLGSIY